MDWDHYLFTKLLKGWKRLRQRESDPLHVANTATLASLAPRLTVLARALTARPIEIKTAEAEGGYQGQVFFLPKTYDRGRTLEDNEQFYLFRVVFLATQYALGLNWKERGTVALTASRRSAHASAPLVLAHMMSEYPMIAPLIARVLENEDVRYTDGVLEQGQNASVSSETPWGTRLFGKWMSPDHLSTEPSGTPEQTLPASDVLPQTEREAPPRESLTAVTLNQKAAEDYTLNHYFEKVETLDAFNGTWRNLDGSDDLDEHGEALQELDLRQTVRTDQPVHSVYQIEFQTSAGIPDSQEATLHHAPCVTYPEWDYKQRAYKANFCKVFSFLAATTHSNAYRQTLITHARTLETLRKRLARISLNRDRVNRQSDGDDLDLDAVVSAYTDMHAHQTPSDFLYTAQRRKRRDLSLLILIDTSLSTDAYAADHRVIDVEIEAVALLSTVLAEQGDRFEIAGFSSRTRNYCEYTVVKRFADPWEKASRRLGTLTPKGYTRMGPAIRHATAILEQETSRKRRILLLSDGKPGDYDRYEGKYGIEDVRQSVRAAAQKNIHVFTLAIQASAKQYLPTLFGQGQFRILPRPQLLPDALSKFYLDLRNR